MESTLSTVGFGGSCHWCTEAIFLSLRGVSKVEQGWIASDGLSLSEAVIVHFDPAIISLDTLIRVHLATHSCTADHSFRSKYRSAVYTFNEDQVVAAQEVIRVAQAEYADPIITQVLPHQEFRVNQEPYLNYYYNDPEKPFCRSFIDPKLRHLMQTFSKEVVAEKLAHLS